MTRGQGVCQVDLPQKAKPLAQPAPSPPREKRRTAPKPSGAQPRLLQVIRPPLTPLANANHLKQAGLLHFPRPWKRALLRRAICPLRLRNPNAPAYNPMLVPGTKSNFPSLITRERRVLARFRTFRALSPAASTANSLSWHESELSESCTMFPGSESSISCHFERNSCNDIRKVRNRAISQTLALQNSKDLPPCQVPRFRLRTAGACAIRRLRAV